MPASSWLSWLMSMNVSTEVKCLAAAAVGAVGAVLIYKYFNEREHHLNRRLRRIYKREQKGEFAPERKPIRIWVDGCFDLMHFGHANAFRQARALGDVLVVGLNTDAEIRLHKGPPIMSEDERYDAVSACKWVDEVVRDVPYVMNEEYLNYIFDKYKIDYVVHGDDPCLLADGTDVFAAAKRSGRFKTVKRTEGVSTTEIVGRMLLMTKSHFRRGSEAAASESGRSTSPTRALSAPATPPSLTRSSSFLPTARRINQFSSGRTPKPADKVVYIDGAWDMFHAGHIDILRQAKELGNFLLVGVHTDEVVNSIRGAHTNFPILNLHERVLSVLSCKYVDEVIIGAPYQLTEDMVRSMNISVVAHGTVRDSDAKIDSSRNPYAVAEKLGLCVELKSRRNLTTSMIVDRIMQQRMDFETKFKKKNAKEQEYLANATFVEERDNAEPYKK